MRNDLRKPRLFETTDRDGNTTTRTYTEKIATGASVSCPEPNIP